MLTIEKLSNGKILDVDIIESNTELQTIGHHRNEYYKIFVVLDGKGYHCIDFEDHLLSKFKVYFIQPGQIHSITKKPTKMYAISFKSEAINVDYRSQSILNSLFFQHHSNQPYISIDSSGLNIISNILEIIRDELSRNVIDYDIISDLFIGSLKFIYRYMPSRLPISVKDDRIVSLYSLIEQHMSEHKDVDFYSEKLSIGSKRLNQVTKEHLNKTVTQIIHEKIITETKRKLAFTNAPVKAISIDMGFKDLGYFCRFYKKHTGESPKKFRDNWNSQQFQIIQLN
ncbi:MULTISPECIES: helix-turn-helix domain-containing protein [unclassified Vibrio]|uniref:helix-turn-helix domain-containing protein n=1 Tax=unclassified Vibrio TaxID=2614977 RepID=UPI001F456894|nr:MULTISPECIES: helix-turn-helix domain-containing protein [unclassified Vibrio]QXL80209.1 HTH-type transcriptional activator RhaR [Vibrio sp.]